MKPLYWTRIQIGASHTPLSGNVVVEIIWDKVEDVEVMGEELEEKFGKADLTTKAKQEVTAEKPKEKCAKIIEGKKSQNLGIFLRSKKINAEIVQEILLKCDTSWEVETLVALQGFKAHPEEELPMLTDHVETKPDVPLDTPDQFLYELSQIHMLDHRLACLLFLSSFSGRLEDVASRLDYIKTCCNFLLSSSQLRNVLGVILGKEFSTNILPDYPSYIILSLSLRKLSERRQQAERSGRWLQC